MIMCGYAIPYLAFTECQGLFYHQSLDHNQVLGVVSQVFLGWVGGACRLLILIVVQLYLFGVVRELDVEKRGVGPSPSALRLFDLHSA